MDSTVHGILQARILVWTAFPFSRGSSPPRDGIQVSCIAGRFFTSWATRETQEYWRGSLSLLQGIVPTQELDPDLPHCRQILYQLSHTHKLDACKILLKVSEDRWLPSPPPFIFFPKEATAFLSDADSQGCSFYFSVWYGVCAGTGLLGSPHFSVFIYTSRGWWWGVSDFILMGLFGQSWHKRQASLERPWRIFSPSGTVSKYFTRLQSVRL